MQRFKLTIEYDGTGLAGWQKQENAPSVQGYLEEALLRFTGLPLSTIAAGRTDAGVHARGQVVHVDFSKEYPLHTITNALNFHLKPHPIAVLQAEAVSDTFHARFSALKRAYTYRIINRNARLALEYLRAWQIHTDLSIERMQEGAQYLLGKHDFTSFRAVACQAASPVKTLESIHCEQYENEILVHVTAPSFLHHMVRNIVGTLVMVGTGKWEPSHIEQILLAKNRAKAGPTAPAYGLYFMKAVYPSET